MDQGLSLSALLNYIRQNHPKKTNLEFWPILENTGSLFSLGSAKIPKVLKDIGLGASLYLLTLKAFCVLFFIMSILNIPVFMIFNSGNEQH